MSRALVWFLAICTGCIVANIYYAQPLLADIAREFGLSVPKVGAVFMPAPQSGSPMTYSANGKQYIIVSISGGNYSGEYLAFSLPDSEIRPSTQAAAR